jgi:hypothetical protein
MGSGQLTASKVRIAGYNGTYIDIDMSKSQHNHRMALLASGVVHRALLKYIP